MKNYLKSEVYRIKSKKLIYFLPFIIAAIPIFGVFLVWSVGLSNPDFEYNNTGFIYRFCRLSFNSLILLIPFLTIYLFSSEYSNGTFKNVVSSGISRRSMYISKYIIILAVLILISIIDLLLIVFTIESLIVHKDPNEQTIFFKSIVQTIPLLIAAFSVSVMLCFTEEKIISNLIKYYLLLYVIPVFFGNFENLIPIIKPYLNVFPVIRMTNDISFSAGSVLFNWLEAIIYFLITFMIGNSIFNKKEI
ncbi:ABC transporter permease [Paenibacillus sp. FSL R7-0652]|jgi:ABC-2 type transport system permease protein|uniref:ABC transporter permease n=1 Tax=Paenibacillus sp. FSL R7-0652 TaxID=2921687 RepID=UPI00315ACD07